MNFDRRAIAAPTRELANWIANLRYEDLPQRTREVVRIAILDTVGAGVYGYNTPWAQMLLACTIHSLLVAYLHSVLKCQHPRNSKCIALRTYIN